MQFQRVTFFHGRQAGYEITSYSVHLPPSNQQEACLITRGRHPDTTAGRHHDEHPEMHADDRPLRGHRQAGQGGASHGWSSQLQEGE